MTTRRPSRRPAGRATDREVGVVEAILVTGSEKAAAHRLGLSHSTVKHHLANARSKVGAETTAQLVWILAPRCPSRKARHRRRRRCRGQRSTLQQLNELAQLLDERVKATGRTAEPAPVELTAPSRPFRAVRPGLHASSQRDAQDRRLGRILSGRCSGPSSVTVGELSARGVPMAAVDNAKESRD